MFNKSKLDQKLFERLCYMIAKKEFWKKWKLTPINWDGWDWWREFYLDLENWDRWCWQCKFFDKLEKSQKNQINDSLTTNKRNDGIKLKKRFLCLPINLTDSIIQKNWKTKPWGWVFIDDLKKRNNSIEINLWLASDFDVFCSEYPLINNYFFWDEKQQRETEIEIINKENNAESQKQAELDKQQINKIFLWWKEEDIDRSKYRYYKYNLQKLRCMDHKLIIDDIYEIEKSIDVEDLNLMKYNDFQHDFQWTVSSYFWSFKPEREILDTSYRYILNDPGKQIGCILTLWINGKFNFSYDVKTNVYSMNIRNG